MRNKALLIVWVILLIGIFVLLSMLGFIHKKEVDSYHEYEDKLVVAARKYVNANKIYPKKGSKIEVNISDIIDAGYIKKKDIEKSCKGTIIVKYDRFIDYLPNIKCKYYKSSTK